MFTTLQINQRVGDLASSHPGAARVLEHAGIDYCCAGKRTLAEACASKHLDAGQVLSLIEQVQQKDLGLERDWRHASMSELADHIESTHHAYVKAEMPRLAALIAKVMRAHSERNPALKELAEVFAALQTEMTDHMRKEEEVLFPALRTLESPVHEGDTSMMWIARGPIRCLVAEHESAGKALARMRELAQDYVVATTTCTTHRVMLASLEHFEADMHLHVHKENNILFPMACRLLGNEECSCER